LYSPNLHGDGMNGLEANLQAFRTADGMLGLILDVTK
jgi:hypothetical protein